MESTAAALLRVQAARENSLRGSRGRISNVSKEFTHLNFFKKNTRHFPATPDVAM